MQNRKVDEHAYFPFCASKLDGKNLFLVIIYATALSCVAAFLVPVYQIFVMKNIPREL